jgi:hypothetical protein
VKKEPVKKLVSYISFDTSLEGIPSSWAHFGEEMREGMKTAPDVKILSRLFDDYISKSRPYLKFSQLDQFRYVMMSRIEKRKLLWHSLLQRRAVQDRFLESLVLLLGSISANPPDKERVGKAFARVKDHIDGELSSNPYLAWVQVRDVLVRYWNLAFRMPFGFIILNRKIVII